MRGKKISPLQNLNNRQAQGLPKTSVSFKDINFDEMPRLASITDFSYYSGTDLDYDSETNCDEAGCDYICRCRRIYNARFEITSLEKFAASAYLANAIDTQYIMQMMKKLRLEESHYWEVEIGGGYYGDEVEKVTLAKKMIDELDLHAYEIMRRQSKYAKATYVKNIVYDLF